MAMYRKVASAIMLISFVGGIAAILACAPPKYAIAPEPPEKYAFSAERGEAVFKIPERRPPGSVKLTVAVVSPVYVEKLPEQYSTLGKSFANSLGASLDEIIVAKGMTAKGPYEDLNIMTYPDKQASNLTLSPEVAITFSRATPVGSANTVFVTVRGSNVLCDVTKVEMGVGGWISMVLREPLSGEKMWVKKLELQKETVSFEVAYRKMQPGQTRPQVVYDTRQDAVALALNKMYPIILKTAWSYLDTNEMLVVNKRSEEVRKLKRY